MYIFNFELWFAHDIHMNQQILIKFMDNNEALKVANSQKVVSKQNETKYHLNGFHETTFTINTYLALNICTYQN